MVAKKKKSDLQKRGTKRLYFKHPEIIQKLIDLRKSPKNTVEDCCKMSGISVDSWYEWLNVNPYFKEEIKKVEANHLAILGELAVKASFKKMMGFEYEESTTTLNGDGKVTSTVVNKKQQLPSDGLMIWLQKNAYPETFSDTKILKTPDLGPENLDELKSEIRKLVKENGFKD